MSSLNELALDGYLIARAHGFWDEPVNFPEKLALIHSEVSEALEDYRNGHAATLTWTEADGKPKGIPSELADIIIRTLDIAAYYEINIQEAVDTKMAYNKTRAYRHGNKRA